MGKATKTCEWMGKIDLATQDGLCEFEILCSLAHNPHYVWQTAKGVSDRTGVAYDSVIAAIARLEGRGLVTPHPRRPGLYGETSSVRPWLSAAKRPSRALAA